MSHLGDRVAPLIDGQLPMDASERAMTHMASCPHCQEAADLERLTKQRLASLGSPQASADLVQRLLALGVTQGPLPPAPGGYLAGTPGPSAFGSGSSSGSGFGSGFGFGPGSPLSPSSSPSLAAPSSAGALPASRPLSMPPSGSPGRGTPPLASRSPRGSSRPAARLSRSTRSRLVLAAASAACLVGVGVAGGVTASPATAKRQVTPPVDSLHQQSSSVPSGPLYGQTALVGASGTGR